MGSADRLRTAAPHCRNGQEGAFVFGPVVVLLLLWKSPTPIAHLLMGIGVLGGLIVASALGGLIYGLIGRRVESVPLIGAYAAGMLSVAPYIACLVLVIRLAEGRPLWVGFEEGEWLAAGFCTVFFGGMIGHMLVRET